MDCKGCGKCCEWISFRIGERISSDTLSWLKYHGIIIRGDNIYIPCRCKHLNEKMECMIYENRPQLCKDLKPFGADCREVLNL